MSTTSRLAFRPIRLAAFWVSALVSMSSGYQVPSIADRGILPYGQYAVGEMETISQTTGVLSFAIPIASLPAGRAGFGMDLKLVYQSALYDTTVDLTTTSNTGGAPTPLLTTKMVVSPHGGWRYAAEYGLLREEKVVIPGQPCSAESLRIYKLRLRTPDGALRLLRLAGYVNAQGTKSGGSAGFDDNFGDGYYVYSPDGLGRSCSGESFPALTNGRLLYYTSDGSYIRVEVTTTGEANWSSLQWTVFLPDGSRASGKGPGTEYFLDRNGNRIDLIRSAPGTTPSTHRFVDSAGREVKIENHFGFDKVKYQGFGGVALEATVNYTAFNVGPRTYTCNSEFALCTDPSYSLGAFSSVILPAAVAGGSTRNYTFTYSICPSCGGELKSVTTPSGASVEYEWALDNASQWPSGVYTNSVSRKKVTFIDNSDPSPVSVLETTDYCFEGRGVGCSGIGSGVSRIAGPDGGVTKTFFSYQLNTPLPHRIEYPDGSVVERHWRRNRAYFSPAQDFTNPYVKTEVRSVANAAGVVTRSHATEFTVERNGNRTEERVYDWVNADTITRPACTTPPNSAPNCPFSGVPGSAVQLRTIASSYFYSPGGIGDGTESPTDHVTAYWNASAPRVLNAPSSREVSSPNPSDTGEQTLFEYDNSTVGPTNGNLTTRRRWDSTKGAKPAVGSPLDATRFIAETFTYDSWGNLQNSTDPRQNITRREYTSSGVLLAAEKAAFGLPIERATSYLSPDLATGLPTTVQDVNNAVDTVYSYDLIGRLTSITEASGVAGQERRTVIEYNDALRRAIERRDLNATGDQKLVTVRYYDSLLRPSRLHQIEDIASQAPETTTGGVKTQYRYRHDATGLRRLTSRPYRAISLVAAASEPTMGWQRECFDRGGRIVSSETFAGATPPGACGTGASSLGMVTTSYNAEYTTVTDEAGKYRQFRADALGRLTEVVEYGPQNYTTTYEYDSRNNLIKVTQGAQIRNFVYTSLSRLKSTKHPETTGSTGHSFQYLYDDAGNLTDRTDARNILTKWGAYDGLNRPTTISYSDGTPKVTYSYDSATNGRGRLAAVTAGGTSQQMLGYDKLGRVTASRQTTLGTDYGFSYTYDLAGNARTVNLPSGRSIAYGVDTAGRIATASGTKSGESGRTYRSSVTFAPHGAAASATLGNNLHESMNFNAKLQPTEVKVGTAAGMSNLLGLTYGWVSPSGKNNGNVWSQTIAVPGFSNLQTYEYDGLNRLTSAREGSGPNWRRDFGHDSFGNMWVSVATGIPVNPAMPTQQSQIEAATNRLAGISYDEAGNQRGIAPSVATYDAENRMMTDRVEILSDVYERTYFYDGLGRRVRKVAMANGVRAAESIFVYDAFGRVAAEYGTGTGGSGTEFLTADPLGSTRLVTSVGGGVVARRDYLPYGEEIPSGTGGRPAEFGAALGTTRKFTGKERDAETGLDFFGGNLTDPNEDPQGHMLSQEKNASAKLPPGLRLGDFISRYYSSALGRFTSPDVPLLDQSGESPQSWNLFSYVRNNPLSFFDPNGGKCKMTKDGLEGDCMSPGDEKVTQGDKPQVHDVNGQQGSLLGFFMASGVPRYVPNDNQLPVNARKVITAAFLQTQHDLGCVGLGGAITGGAGAASAPLVPKPFSQGGASSTSVVSTVLGGGKLGTRVKTPVGMPGTASFAWRYSPNVGRIAGRYLPYVGAVVGAAATYACLGNNP